MNIINANKKRAYITVLSTEEYLIGVLALNESLRKVNSKYNLVTLVNDNISIKSKEILRKNNIEIIEIKKFELPEWILNKNKQKRSNWNYTFDKLHIFELTQYDKLVFLDSDMFVRNNIDELFERADMSATVDRHDTVLVKESFQKLTSGLLVVEPREGILEEFKNIINNPYIRENYNTIGDQDIIQLYAKNWEVNKELHIPITYNMFFLHVDYFVNKKIYSLEEISVIHFICKNKPWKYSQEEIKTVYLDFLEEILKKDYETNKLEEIRETIQFGRENQKKIIEEYSKILYKCKEQIEQENI